MSLNNIPDISHWESVNWDAMFNAGVNTVIAKATQGLVYVDPKYARFREEAYKRGMNFGSYHFGTGDNVEAQVEHYISHANISDKDFVCLDFEPNPHGPSMTLAQAKRWISYFIGKIGRAPMIYGGHWLKEQMSGPDNLINQCPLWLAQYGSKAVLPPGWDKYTLWQYTDGEVGPGPHEVPGIGPCDRNQFEGSQNDLDAQWPLTHKAPVPTPPAAPESPPEPTPAPPVVNGRFTQNWAVYSISDIISFGNVQKMAAAWDAQMKEDRYPHWGRHVNIIAVESGADVPFGYFSHIIMDDIGDPSALGYHTMENGQPAIYTKAQDFDGTSITGSHEHNEAAQDPDGMRTIPIFLEGYGQVLVLVELSDPCEAVSYLKNGVAVSDFLLENWYDARKQPGIKYTFCDSIREPRTIIRGGYFSFQLANGQWMQRVFWGDSQEDQGPFNWKRKDGESLRECVDRETRSRRSGV